MLFDCNKEILEFAQKCGQVRSAIRKWRCLITGFMHWRGIALECPDEFTVEKVEKCLHEQLWKTIKETDGEEGPPHPWHPKS